MRIHSLAAFVIAVGLGGIGTYACAVANEPDPGGVGTGPHDATAEAAEPFDGYGGGGDDGGTTENEGGNPTGDGGKDDSGGGLPADCKATNNCQSARATVPASISGDSSPANNSVTVQGSSDDWIKIRATENDHGITGHAMKVKAVLTSPAGGNYDIAMYVDDSTDQVSCPPSQPVETSSVSGSQTDQVVHTWGETGTFSNGSDDSRTVTFHVKYVSGPCGPGNEWTLVITGNP